MAGERLAADAIMASNTSSIPITRMANYAPDPARFIGLHFFNPVPVMQLIEVIPGLATNETVTERTCAFARALGKDVLHRLGTYKVNLIENAKAPVPISSASRITLTPSRLLCSAQSLAVCSAP